MTDADIPVPELLVEFDRALDYTESLWVDLTDAEVAWRPHEDFSPIGWHLGHQAAVSHFMVRNLLAAEPSLDTELDALMDSATPESQRDRLPDRMKLSTYRGAAAERLRFRVGAIVDGHGGATDQLTRIAAGLVTAVTNHEYQHSRWISEVRSRELGHALPELPTAPLLDEIDGYLVVGRR